VLQMWKGQTTWPQSAISKKPSATIVVRKAMLQGRAEADQGTTRSTSRPQVRL